MAYMDNKVTATLTAARNIPAISPLESVRAGVTVLDFEAFFL
jgi:hypothetical protein